MPATPDPAYDDEPGFRELVRADYAAFLGTDTNSHRGASRLRRLLDVLTWPGFVAVVVFRCAHATSRLGLFPIARILTYLNLSLHGCEFHPRAVIGPGLVVLHPQGCGFGPGVRVGRNCKLVKTVVLGTGGFDDPSRDGFPQVGDNVVFCDGSSAWGPVTIGDNSVLGAGVRLFRSVPPASKVVLNQRQMVLSALDGLGPQRRHEPVEEERVQQ